MTVENIDWSFGFRMDDNTQVFVRALVERGVVKVQDRSNLLDFERSVFYENFISDDCDWIVRSDDEVLVRAICEAIFVCDFDVKFVEVIDPVNGFAKMEWWGVTYHS